MLAPRFSASLYSLCFLENSFPVGIPSSVGYFSTTGVTPPTSSGSAARSYGLKVPLGNPLVSLFLWGIFGIFGILAAKIVSHLTVVFAIGWYNEVTACMRELPTSTGVPLFSRVGGTSVWHNGRFDGLKFEGTSSRRVLAKMWY
jgi:hypothetical protein